MNPTRTKTGEYIIVRACVEAIIDYMESAWFMGFHDHNVHRALLSDGVPSGEPEDPEDPESPMAVYKIDAMDLVTVIHYLLDHRRRLVAIAQDLRDGLAAGDYDTGCNRLLIEALDAALENRPGPFENGAGKQAQLL